MKRAYGTFGLLLMTAGIAGLASEDPNARPLPQAAAQESEGRLVDTWTVGHYTVRVRSLGDEQELIIARGDRILLRQRGVSFAPSHVLEGDEPRPLVPGRDLTGDGSPDLALSEWTGGAHATRVWVFELGEELRAHPPIAAAHDAVAYFEAVDARPGLEFRTHDWTFAHWRTDFASSPAPDVVLAYQDGAYRPAWGLMPPPRDSELDRQVATLQGDPGWEAGEVPPALWAAMLDWIFGSQPTKAWELLERAWPEDRNDREAFAAAFRSQLAKSPYCGSR